MPRSKPSVPVKRSDRIAFFAADTPEEFIPQLEAIARGERQVFLAEDSPDGLIADLRAYLRSKD